MKYPALLRAALLASPLGIREDDLFIFVTDGKVIRYMGSTRKDFAIEYTLRVMVTDFSGPEAGLLLFINDWLDGLAMRNDEGGAERFTGYDRGKAYEFESDILSNSAVDLVLSIPLREQIAVSVTPDGITLDYS